MSGDYPFLDVFWTMVIFFAWVSWLWLLIRCFTDLFRRRELGGVAKVLWAIFLIALPFLGVFAYLIAQAGRMAERDARETQASQRQFDDYVRTVAGTGGAAAEIERAKGLLDSGAITPAEYDAIKAAALA